MDNGHSCVPKLRTAAVWFAPYNFFLLARRADRRIIRNHGGLQSPGRSPAAWSTASQSVSEPSVAMIEIHSPAMFWASARSQICLTDAKFRYRPRSSKNCLLRIRCRAGPYATSSDVQSKNQPATLRGTVPRIRPSLDPSQVRINV